MGTYLNPGVANYGMALNSAIFVDKSEMIAFLNSVVNTQQRFVCVSRPRRFGKTIAADMICAYYDRQAESRPLFKNLKIGKSAPVRVGQRVIPWDAYLGAFDVIRITMTRFVDEYISMRESLQKMQKHIIHDIKKTYPDVDYFDDTDLLQTIGDVYSDRKRQIVIVIDEWDAVFRMCRNDKDKQTEYLNFLRDLLKDNPYIALAYMTGILPIKKYGMHSALNMFSEYSMMYPRELAPYTGFTDEEVQNLSYQYGRDYARIKDWYDGYLVSNIIPPDPGYIGQLKTDAFPVAKRYSLYSPLSVVEALTTGIIQNYWNRTETYEALAEYIRMDYDGLKDAVALLMDGGRIPINPSTYQNDMTTFQSRDDILALLIHLGYLGFDADTREVFIPNKEILDEFKTSTLDKEWADTFTAFKASQELLKATWARDAKKVAELLEQAHNRTGNKTYNDEAALSYAVQLAYYAARKYYTVIQEMDTGKGYADLVFLPSPRHPGIPAMLVELKYNQSADTALEQIRRQEYPQELEHYQGNLLLVGINYNREAPSNSPAFKRHSCIIVQN